MNLENFAMKFNVNVECCWFAEDGNTVIERVERTYRVTADEADDAEQIAEERASQDTNFNRGKPEQVWAMDVT